MRHLSDIDGWLIRAIDHGIGVSAEEIGIETLDARIRSAVVRAAAQVRFFPQYTAAARIRFND